MTLKTWIEDRSSGEVEKSRALLVGENSLDEEIESEDTDSNHASCIFSGDRKSDSRLILNGDNTTIEEIERCEICSRHHLVDSGNIRDAGNFPYGRVCEGCYREMEDEESAAAAAEEEIEKEAQDLGDGEFYVLRTAFHGGGTVFGPGSATDAIRARNAYRVGDCTCGCAGIVAAADIDDLPTECGSDPYALIA